MSPRLLLLPLPFLNLLLVSPFQNNYVEEERSKKTYSLAHGVLQLASIVHLIRNRGKNRTNTTGLSKVVRQERHRA
jgi:hypothetical protein